MGQIELEALKPGLSHLGFKKRADGIFTIELSRDFVGWLGLNRLTKRRPKGDVGIYPQVGVRCQSLERLISGALERPNHSYIPPSIVRPLPYLMPAGKYRTWEFSEKTATEAAEDFTRAIAKFGVPFMKSNADLTQIARRLDEGMHNDSQHITHARPIVALLIGDIDGARSAVQETRATVFGLSDESSEKMRAYLDNVEILLKETRK